MESSIYEDRAPLLLYLNSENLQVASVCRRTLADAELLEPGIQRLRASLIEPDIGAYPLNYFAGHALSRFDRVSGQELLEVAGLRAGNKGSSTIDDSRE